MYKVTITQIIKTQGKSERRWAKIGEELVQDHRGDPAKKDIYGYTPEYDIEKETEREIYNQTVDYLDIAQVVSVINSKPKITVP